jgi:PAS domain S-box-containing protein
MKTARGSPESHERFSYATPALGGLAYLALSILWILLSDHAGAVIFTTTEELSAFQTYKGLGFVVVSAIAVYLILRASCRSMGRLPAIERKLHDSEQQYGSLVELSPDGIVVHQGGRIVYANPAFRRMLGLTRRVEGLSLADLFHPSQRAFIQERLSRLSHDVGTSAPAELKIQGAAGNEIEVEHASSSVRVGGSIVVQSHFRDLTSRNQARRELELANQSLEIRVMERTTELEAANRALETFTSSVAHDLRAPVAHVDGFAKALEAAVLRGDADKACHYTKRIVHNAQLMSQMIDGLLRLSRADRAELDYDCVDCDEVVQEVLDELDKPASVQIQVEPLAKVRADAATLRQVWANLISNAVKFSARAAAPCVRISSAAGASETIFSVSDNGVGFDPADAENLFGVFQRLPTARDFAGTGIGLTIVRRIVERHGGRVWTHSQPGQGATFSFSLPDPSFKPA